MIGRGWIVWTQSWSLLVKFLDCLKIQYTIYNIQYTIYNIQYTIHNIQYTLIFKVSFHSACSLFVRLNLSHTYHKVFVPIPTITLGPKNVGGLRSGLFTVYGLSILLQKISSPTHGYRFRLIFAFLWCDLWSKWALRKNTGTFLLVPLSIKKSSAATIFISSSEKGHTVSVSYYCHSENQTLVEIICRDNP